MNNVTLVGRITSIAEGVIVIKVSRNYKNEVGEYEVDQIPVYLGGKLAEQIREYCPIDSIVGVKARITRQDHEEVKIVADKVTFLASRKKNE